LNPTIKILKIIGSPFAPTTETPKDGKEALELFTYAVNNRMPLLYLETLKRQEKLNGLKTNYEQRYAKYLKFLDTMVKTSNFLDSLNVEHVVVKTLKPYPSTPNDIDILCLGSDEEYRRAKEALLQAGYRRIFDTPAPRQIKLMHPEEKIWIDLHKEMGVSAIVLMDKKKLNKYTINKKLPNVGNFKVLMPEADLALVMIHSLVTEQLYTLAEYYTTLYWLAETGEQGAGNFFNIVKENNITLAVKTHIALTAALHRTAHGIVPKHLDNILTKLGTETSETSRFFKNEFKTPHRYHLSKVFKALVEKMQENETRKSVISQIIHMLNPNFTRILVNNLLDRRKREAQREV